MKKIIGFGVPQEEALAPVKQNEISRSVVDVAFQDDTVLHYYLDSSKATL